MKTWYVYAMDTDVVYSGHDTAEEAYETQTNLSEILRQIADNEELSTEVRSWARGKAQSIASAAITIYTEFKVSSLEREKAEMEDYIHNLESANMQLEKTIERYEEMLKELLS